MLRATLTGMLHRKLRLALSALAVVLGVTFVAGSFVLTDTLSRSFDEIFADAYSDTDVQVQGEPKVAVDEFEGEQVPAPVPDDTVDRVAAVPSVADATGLVEADGARLIGEDGDVVASLGPPQLGMNWTGEGSLLQLRQGHGPTADDEIAINAGLADAAGVAVGDRVGVLTLEPRQDFTVVGVFGYSGNRDSLGGVQQVAFTDPVAQKLMLGERGVFSSVDVRAADGVAPQQLRDEVAAALGDGFRVRTGDQLAAEQAEGLQEGLTFFNYLLLGFAGVALFVGVFLIVNTFSIIVAQRTRELALTRAIGASRRQVIGSVLLEAVVIGLVASVVGLAAGVGVGALLAALAAGFMSLPLAGLGVPATAVIAAFAVGLLVTLVAAALPAVRAARVAPVAAMQESATADRPLTRLTISGAVLLAGGVAALIAGLTGPTLWLVLAGVLATFTAVALLTPLIARPASAGLGRLFSWSVAGKLGRLNSGRNPRRTAITAAALMVGVALVSGVNVVIQSASTSFASTFEDTLQAELLITGEQTGPRPPSFDITVLQRAEELPEVQSAAGMYNGRAMIDGERASVNATNDLAALADLYGAEATTGTLGTLGEGELAVSDHVTEQQDLSVGDQVTVQLSRGDPHRLTVAAVFADGDLPGRYLLPSEITDDMAVPHPYLGLVGVTPGASVEEVRDQLAAWLVDSPEVSVTDQSGFIEQQQSQLDMVLDMIGLLLLLAIVIAVLGIINTLALSVLERTRELGMLRAVGLSRAATMRMVTVESVVISLFGAVLGMAVGTGLGAAVVRALADEGVTTLAVPWNDYAVYLVAAGAVGVVAAVLPAIRAARTDVLAAIAYE